MDAAPKPPPLTLFSFDHTQQPITLPSAFATGSDVDIGGLSTCSLTPVPSPEASGHLAFHGNLSLRVPPEYAGRIRTGYAAFRNKSRPTLFGEDTWDLSLYSHIRVVLGYRGWDAWRGRWALNIQTDGPVRSDLFQHRLDIPPSSASSSSRIPLDLASAPAPAFSTLHLPLSSFVLTNSGQTSSSQIPMLRSKIRTLGFALLGNNRTDDGSAPPTTAEDEAKRIGAGGWGRDKGDVHVDQELEELIRSDHPAPGETPAPARPASKYHTLGSTPPARPAAQGEDIGTAAGTEAVGMESEGYFELCIKSVEAVNWDPEADGPDGVTQ